MPPVLRICTGATCPRKSLAEMSAALRTASGPAGGAASRGACRTRSAVRIVMAESFVQVMEGSILNEIDNTADIVIGGAVDGGGFASRECRRLVVRCGLWVFGRRSSAKDRGRVRGIPP